MRMRMWMRMRMRMRIEYEAGLSHSHLGSNPEQIPTKNLSLLKLNDFVGDHLGLQFCQDIPRF